MTQEMKGDRSHRMEQDEDPVRQQHQQQQQESAAPPAVTDELQLLFMYDHGTLVRTQRALHGVRVFLDESPGYQNIPQMKDIYATINDVIEKNNRTAMMLVFLTALTQFKPISDWFRTKTDTEKFDRFLPYLTKQLMKYQSGERVFEPTKEELAFMNQSNQTDAKGLKRRGAPKKADAKSAGTEKKSGRGRGRPNKQTIYNTNRHFNGPPVGPHVSSSETKTSASAAPTPYNPPTLRSGIELQYRDTEQFLSCMFMQYLTGAMPLQNEASASKSATGQ